jgi:hypothetical protein
MRKNGSAASRDFEQEGMSVSPSTTSSIGAVFTPEKWALWLIEQYQVVQRWREGATICDPTGGKGAFLLALVEATKKSGCLISKHDLDRLFIIERSLPLLETFSSEFERRFRMIFPEENIFHADVIINNPSCKVDFLIGNPPWVNFNELPSDYKTSLKSHFLESGLILDRKGLLLGSSRVDLAALIISTVMRDNLRDRGEAAFFVPLSLFTGDTAHAGFRSYESNGCTFRLESVWDFRKLGVFPDILANFGVAHFRRDARPAYPITYKIHTKDGWTDRLAAPLGTNTSPLSVFDTVRDYEALCDFQPIPIRDEQVPRQGINTCGANHVFHFDEIPTDLPEQFVFPLITKECFNGSNQIPKKFILLPYDRNTGQPLSEAQLRSKPGLHAYLRFHEEKLRQRKGTMLNGWLKRGVWWACLGVGPYCFSRYKIVWESYGRSNFRPRLLSTVNGQEWQANQALQAFMPCSDAAEASELLEKLESSKVEAYLRSLAVEGTCNWAQPGRIKRFLQFTHPKRRNRAVGNSANQLEF